MEARQQHHAEFKDDASQEDDPSDPTQPMVTAVILRRKLHHFKSRQGVDHGEISVPRNQHIRAVTNAFIRSGNAKDLHVQQARPTGPEIREVKVPKSDDSFLPEALLAFLPTIAWNHSGHDVTNAFQKPTDPCHQAGFGPQGDVAIAQENTHRISQQAQQHRHERWHVEEPQRNIERIVVLYDERII